MTTCQKASKLTIMNTRKKIKPPVKVETGSQLRKWRESNGITRETLASDIGKAVKTIYRYETQNKLLDKDILILLNSVY